MNYKEMKEQIIEAVGGKDNIKNVAHCATRLRLVLVDDSNLMKKPFEKLTVSSTQLKSVDNVKSL